MTNISIISDCNNNCKYCFQEDSFHKSHVRLTYDDFVDIVNWTRDRVRVGVLGGEPTLHPDMVKMLIYASRQYQNVALFTNLLCDKSILDDMQRYVPDTMMLINTTTRVELLDLFEENIEHLSKIRTKPVKLGLTFMNDPEFDTNATNRMIGLAKRYPKLVDRYRIAIATPHHREEVNIDSFEKPILDFCEKAKKETPNLLINFDCPINNCQLPLKATAKLIEDYGVLGVKPSFACGPIVEVMADKSVKCCASLPDGFLEVKHYRDFVSDLDLSDYFRHRSRQFMMEHRFACRKLKNCNNEFCGGLCLALTAYLKMGGKL